MLQMSEATLKSAVSLFGSSMVTFTRLYDSLLSRFLFAVTLVRLLGFHNNLKAFGFGFRGR